MLNKQLFTTYEFAGRITEPENQDIIISYYFGLIFDPKTRTIWHKIYPYDPTYALDNNVSGSSHLSTHAPFKNTYNEVHNDYEYSSITSGMYSGIFGYDSQINSRVNFSSNQGVGNFVFGMCKMLIYFSILCHYHLIHYTKYSNITNHNMT